MSPNDYTLLDRYTAFKRSSDSSDSSNKKQQQTDRMSASEHEIPVASASEEEQTVSVSIDVDDILAAVKSLSADDLFKINAAVMTELKKRSKNLREKEVSPKKRAAPQLDKSRKWVEFTEQYATAYGWEAFEVQEKKKDGSIIITEIAAGVENADGDWVIADTGKKLIRKQAMVLSKLWWSPKAKEGSHPEIYEAFEAQYAPPAVSETASEADSEESSTTKSTVVRKTSAEKLAEAEAKKAAKEEAKAKKEAEKEAKKEKAAALKDAMGKLREAIKAKSKADLEETIAAAKEAGAKEDDKTLQKAVATLSALETVEAAKPSKVTITKVVSKAAPAPAAAKPAPAATKPAPAATKAAAKKPAVEKEVDTWEPPKNPSSAKAWTFKGKNYFRSGHNEVWEVAEDGDMGDWVGMYEPASNSIDTSVPEPEEDEE